VLGVARKAVVGVPVRRDARRDSNHADAVGWYRELGCAVADTANLGMGLPDLFVSAAGVCDAVEVKSEKGELTPLQKNFIACWRAKVWIVRTHLDVVSHVGHMRKRARLVA
jgi:hypothetical protein